MQRDAVQSRAWEQVEQVAALEVEVPQDFGQQAVGHAPPHVGAVAAGVDVEEPWSGGVRGVQEVGEQFPADGGREGQGLRPARTVGQHGRGAGALVQVERQHGDRPTRPRGGG
ncbi:hypothetical protein ACFQES_05015 [Nonomuraea salmonea]|uniref:hypothetical protein n=1 Tax=Nonomuraea salmonea TaxID=46181 RepID=UPI00361984FF